MYIRSRYSQVETNRIVVGFVVILHFSFGWCKWATVACGAKSSCFYGIQIDVHLQSFDVNCNHSMFRIFRAHIQLAPNGFSGFNQNKRTLCMTESMVSRWLYNLEYGFGASLWFGRISLYLGSEISKKVIALFGLPSVYGIGFYRWMNFDVHIIVATMLGIWCCYNHCCDLYAIVPPRFSV